MTDPAAHDSPSERDVKPLDLDAIEARNFTAARYVAEGDEYAGFTWDSARDVPALVAEVRRLREDLAAQETSTCHLGDLLRATVNALKGDPPPLTTWSTHDLPDVAAEMRRRDEYSVAIIAVGETMKEEYIQRARDLSRFRGQACYTAGLAKRLLPSLETHGEDGWPLDRVAADALAAEVERLRARLATAPPDDPEADGTDAAHPAWWRGNDAGCKGAMSLLARLRTDNDALRARVAELERLVKGDTTPPTDAEIDAHDGPWWIVLDHAAGFATRCAEGDEAKVWARRQRERGAAYVWRAFHMSTGELVRRCAAAAPKPMGFAEALDAVRRGPVGPSGCARCGEIATAACDACGVHLCSVCGATPTCDDGDPCALRRYPHPDKEPLLCVDIDAWGRALG